MKGQQAHLSDNLTRKTLGANKENAKRELLAKSL